MRWYDRFLILLSSFFVIAISFLFLLFIFNLFSLESYLSVFNTSLQTNNNVYFVTLISTLIFGLIGFRVLWFSLVKKNIVETVETVTELGNIHISSDTLVGLAEKTVGKIKGVKEQKIRVKIINNDNVHLFIRLKVDGEYAFPNLTENVQKEVVLTLNEIAGISAKVNVLIENLVTKIEKSRLN